MGGGYEMGGLGERRDGVSNLKPPGGGGEVLWLPGRRRNRVVRTFKIQICAHHKKVFPKQFRRIAYLKDIKA